MSKKPNKKQQNLFHLFIQSAHQLPVQSTIFPYFQFMDQSIRKIFHQLKKTQQKKQKQLTCFQELWDDLDNDDKVMLYSTWTKLLNKALQMQKNPNFKLEPQSLNLQDQIYIKKSGILNSKWEKKNAKLTHTQLLILSSKVKQYDLKDYEIRKLKSRENYAWVLQPINKNGKLLQCGVSSQTMFDEWFSALKININNQRIYTFLMSIKQERQNPGSVRRKYSDLKSIQLVKKQKSSKVENKTLTERIIDQQMKPSDHEAFSDIQSQKQQNSPIQQKNNAIFHQQEKIDKKQETQEKKKLTEAEGIESNPNIFKKLIPTYHSLMSFADTPVNSSLLYCDSEYRIYELPSRQDEQISLKFFTVLPYQKSLIFKALGSESIGWNDEIDVLTVKTKISSQNTVLLYQKNKPQGILYRERDFLYLRHCFTIANFKQKNTFFVDKSIDSIHHPPFMTVVRAERQLIWGLIEKESGKECILIVQGWIKGGGYMSHVQNKEMTLKYMKKLSNLNGYLKQISYIENNKTNILFNQNWIVDITKTDEAERKGSINTEQKQIQAQDWKQFPLQEKKFSQQQKQLAQFMKRTNEEQLGSQQLNKSQVIISDEKIQPESYVPPSFNKQKFVIIPTQYLKKVHIIVPKQKPKKPKYFPHYRGHHLWKGEWQVLSTGGLGYVDVQKMQEQKKVLTYIIKRIGRNIFSGKGILNISLPVDIFCIQSNIQRLAMSFGYFPPYLQKAAQIKQPQIQLKYLVSGVIAGSLVYLTMQKPFNPILGQTFQCWVDNCPIYFEQISHHPPVAAFLMKGRGYTISACVQAKMDLSINSGTGVNQGVFKVQFDNGNVFYYSTASGCLTGLTYGERKLNLVGKAFFWSEKGLFLQLTYNPAAKTKGFFSGTKGEGDQKLPDYFQGQVKQYTPNQIKQICSKKLQNKEVSIIPKGPPSAQPIKTLYKICGRWNKYVLCGQQKTFDVDQNRYIAITQQKYPLPSHSNYREDIVYRRMKNFVTSQDFKQVLQVKQREDRKLRAKYGLNTSH